MESKQQTRKENDKKLQYKRRVHGGAHKNHLILRKYKANNDPHCEHLWNKILKWKTKKKLKKNKKKISSLNFVSLKVKKDLTLN